MRADLGRAVLAALASLALGCSDDSDAGFHADDDTAGDDDTSEDAPDWEPSGEDGPDWSGPVRIDAVHGSTPAILIRDASLAHVFFHDLDEPGGDTGALVRRDHTGALGDLPAPTPLGVDGYWPHAVEIDSRVHLLSTTRATTHHLVGDELTGGFETLDTVASTDSAGCDGRQGPSRVARVADGDLRLGLGFVQHNAVLGCVNEARFARFEDDAWTEPAHITSGWPSGIFDWPGDRLVLTTSRAVFTSTDGGETFVEHVDADTTQGIVSGADSVQLDDGTILLARSYSWAMDTYLSLAAGDPDTGQWTSPWVRLASTPLTIEEVRIARWGDTLVVAWLESRTDEIIDAYRRLQAFSRISHDNGATWSEETQLSVSDPGEQLRELALAAGQGRTLAAYVLIRADGAREVQLVEARW